jgi:phage FluMu protein Com
MVNRPVMCWHCGKTFSDIKRGTFILLPSTDLIEFTFENPPSILEIMCPRCKYMNSVIPLDIVTFTDVENLKSIKEKTVYVTEEDKKYFKVLHTEMKNNRYDVTKFK